MGAHFFPLLFPCVLAGKANWTGGTVAATLPHVARLATITTFFQQTIHVYVNVHQLYQNHPDNASRPRTGHFSPALREAFSFLVVFKVKK